MDQLRQATHINPPTLIVLMLVWWAWWLLIAWIGNKWIDWKHGIRR